MSTKEEFGHSIDGTNLFRPSLECCKTTNSKTMEQQDEDFCETIALQVDLQCQNKYFRTAPILRSTKVQKVPDLLNKTSIGDKIGGCDRRYGIKINESKINYFGLLKYLFPEIAGIPSLNINVMDAIFYNSDGSMCYICTDANRGLIKTKCKNYCQIFLKRKAELDQTLPSKTHFINSSPSFKDQYDQTYETFHKYLNYVALLRYKDDSFIRLKEAQFKSIFLRPVQANQKFKFVGNTQYIQILPKQILLKQKTLHQIQFKLQEHKNTQFFIQAIQKHAEQSSYIRGRSSKQKKKKLKESCRKSFMLYSIFQMFAYINIHYHKHLTYGIFQFMQVSSEFYLSNVRKAKLVQNAMIRSQYQRSPLINGILSSQDNEYQGLQSLPNGVIDVMKHFFDVQNNKICNQVRNFVKQKFEQVQNKPDIQQSCQIFSFINQNCAHNFHDVLQSQSLYTKFLRKKKNQLDGFSPLTSISNIARKKYDRKCVNQRIWRSKVEKQDANQKRRKQSKFNGINLRGQRRAKSKWFKKQFNSGKNFMTPNIS